MAVLNECPGLEVQIVANKQALREHEDRNAKVAHRVSERYVEAQSGANFELQYSFKTPFLRGRAVSMIVSIDGEDVDEPLVRPEDLFEPGGHVSAGLIAKVGSRWGLQPYCFAPLDIRKSDIGTLYPRDDALIALCYRGGCRNQRLRRPDPKARISRSDILLLLLPREHDA